MDKHTLSEKLAAMSGHRLITIKYTPVWEQLLAMLRPTDIVSLTRATLFCLRPTEQQINKYMLWWRQTFYSLKFVDKNAIYCLGKGLHLLKTAIQRWECIEASKIKLLVLVKNTAPLNEASVLQNTLFESLDTPYMWHTNPSNLSEQDQPVQTCIIFSANTISLHIDSNWSTELCLGEVRLRQRQVRPGSSTLHTYFTDLRRPSFVNRVDNNNFGFRYMFVAMNTLVKGGVEITRIGSRALKVFVQVTEKTWSPPERYIQG
jgi:hypothetical protein